MTLMRVQRALARAGVASRRAAEELIEDGGCGSTARWRRSARRWIPTAEITVDGKRGAAQKPSRWLAFTSRSGVVTTAKDEEGRQTVFDLIPEPEGLTYVGRLDVMTTGLLLLTTDGDAVHRLTHPRYQIQRSYTALVHGMPTAEIDAAVKQPRGGRGRPVIPTRVRVRPGADGRSIWTSPSPRAQAHRAALGRGAGAQGGAAGAAVLRPDPPGRPAGREVAAAHRRRKRRRSTARSSCAP